MKGKRVIFPKCPGCNTRHRVGRVATYDYKRNGNMSAYYCSNCFTEFKQNGEILEPLWLNEKESSVDFLNR